jgi:DNA-binding MarR family transcriptional regulator
MAILIMSVTTSRSDISQAGLRPPRTPDSVPVRRAAAPLVRRLQQICVSMVADALAGAELVQLEFAVLVFIDNAPGIDQRTLAEAMGIDRNNTSVIVERLEARGLVERDINAADRRARQLSLTPAGKNLWRKFFPQARAANNRILAPLQPAERKLFINMLVRLVEAHRVHARPGAGRRKRQPVNHPSEQK